MWHWSCLGPIAPADHGLAPEDDDDDDDVDYYQDDDDDDVDYRDDDDDHGDDDDGWWYLELWWYNDIVKILWYCDNIVLLCTRAHISQIEWRTWVFSTGADGRPFDSADSRWRYG